MHEAKKSCTLCEIVLTVSTAIRYTAVFNSVISSLLIQLYFSDTGIARIPSQSESGIIIIIIIIIIIT